MDFIQVLTVLGATLIKMGAIFMSCGLGVIVLAGVLKAVAGPEIETALKKLFSW